MQEASVEMPISPSVNCEIDESSASEEALSLQPDPQPEGIAEWRERPLDGIAEREDSTPPTDGTQGLSPSAQLIEA